MLKIVIDPACGGKTLGHQSFHQFANIVEKDYVLELSKLQQELFLQNQMNTLLTRQQDVDTDLKTRIACTGDADLLISNHLNAGKKRGIEIRYSQHHDTDFVDNLVKAFERRGFLVRSCRTYDALGYQGRDYDPILEQSKAKCSVMIFYGYVDSSDYYSLTVGQRDFSHAVLQAIHQTYGQN